MKSTKYATGFPKLTAKKTRIHRNLTHKTYRNESKALEKKNKSSRKREKEERKLPYFKKKTNTQKQSWKKWA